MSKNKKIKRPQAEYIDDVLTLSFPNAVDPIVWRMDVNDIKTASFEIQSLKDKQEFKLFLKPQGGTEQVIARFSDKDAAFDALMLASDALHQDNSSAKTTGKKPTAHKKRGAGKWLLLIAGLILVLGLYIYMINLVPNTQDFQTTTAATTTNNQPARAQDKTGVPVSADDFFEGL